MKTKPCKCGRGKIMTGRHSQFNAKLKDGTQACNECKLEEIYAASFARQQPEVAND